MLEGVQTVEATAERIIHKELSKNGKPFVLYLIETDRGEFSTTKGEIAEQAHKQLHKPASYDVKVVQKGEYTNYYLEAVAPIEAPPRTVSGAFPNPAPVATQPVFEEAPAPAFSIDGISQKDLLIFRQVAAKVAAQIWRPGDPANDFWDDVEDLMTFFVTGNKPGE